MKNMLNDNWSLDDVRAAVNKLRARNNVSIILAVGVIFVMLSALAAFLVYRFRFEDDFDYYFDDDDDYADGIATDDDFED